MQELPAPHLDREAVASLVLERTVEGGGRVRHRRKDLGLTQAVLAALADTTPETICRIELGQLLPREPLKLAVAFALHREVHEIWPPVTRDTLQRRALEPEFIMEATA